MTKCTSSRECSDENQDKEKDTPEDAKVSFVLIISVDPKESE